MPIFIASSYFFRLMRLKMMTSLEASIAVDSGSRVDVLMLTLYFVFPADTLNVEKERRRKRVMESIFKTQCLMLAGGL